MTKFSRVSNFTLSANISTCMARLIHSSCSHCCIWPSLAKRVTLCHVHVMFLDCELALPYYFLFSEVYSDYGSLGGLLKRRLPAASLKDSLSSNDNAI